MNWLNAFWLINYNKRFISCLFSALVIVRKYVLVHSGEDEFAEVFSPFCWSGDHEYKLPSPSGGRLTRPGWPPGISQLDRACPGETRARPSGCVYACRVLKAVNGLLRVLRSFHVLVCSLSIFSPLNVRGYFLAFSSSSLGACCVQSASYFFPFCIIFDCIFGSPPDLLPSFVPFHWRRFLKPTHLDVTIS